MIVAPPKLVSRTAWAGLIAVALVPGCEGPYPPTSTTFSCSGRQRIMRSLSEGVTDDFYITKEAKDVQIKPGWCQPAGIQLIPYYESALETTYSVRCDGNSKFNVRLMKGSSKVKLSIERYAETSVPMRAEKCTR